MLFSVGILPADLNDSIPEVRLDLESEGPLLLDGLELDASLLASSACVTLRGLPAFPYRKIKINLV